MGRIWIFMVALAACAGAHGGGGGDTATFHVFYPDAPATGAHARVGKRFYAKPVGQCIYDNGRDARWAMTGAHIETGALPPGLSLEDGAITGTPTKAGEFSAHIKFAGVVCAGKPYADQFVDVAISATAR